jgi:hypothetical protein
VDGLTGQLVEKSDPTRRVTSYYEGKLSQQKKRKQIKLNKVFKKNKKITFLYMLALCLGAAVNLFFI